MKADEFRALALAVAGAVESSHMNHPDFRLRGKVFATLGWPDEAWGMVNLPPDIQAEYLAKYPEIFIPANGAWGKKGSTLVKLAKASKTVVKPAVAFAASKITSPK